MSKQILTLFLLLAFALTCIAQGKSEKYVELKGGFSFDIPEGWHAYEGPNAKYKVVFGQRENDFTPNITVEEDSCPCPLSEYVDLAQGRLEAGVKGVGLDTVKLLNRAEFITSSGLKGWKLTNAGTAKSRSFVMRQYIFEGKEKGQIIFTCGALAESASTIESKCDGAMKTLTFATSATQNKPLESSLSAQERKPTSIELSQAVENRPDSWKEFSSDEGNFKILMPGTPEAVNPQVDTKIGKLRFQIYLLNTELGVYVVSYTDFPTYSYDPSFIKRTLDGGRDELLKSGRKLLNETEFTLDGITGRELVLEDAGNVFRARIFWVNGRLYQLVISVPPNIAFKNGHFTSNPDERTEFYEKISDRFFSSFKLKPLAKTFTSSAGEFTIQLPERPSALFTNQSGDGTVVHTFDWLLDTGEVTVVYRDNTELLEDSKSSKSFLDQLRDNAIAIEKGKLISERDISLDGHPGREVKIETSTSIFVDRIFLVKNRLYIATAFIPTAKLNQEAAAIKNLDTFKLITETQEPLGEVDRLLKELKVKNEIVLGGCKEEAKCSPLLISDDKTDGAAEVKNGTVLNMPQPAYPPIARAAHASGTVQVQVVVDESGKVIAAQVVSGHPLLQAAAVKAARELLLTPSFLNGKAVKVVGVVNYNFVLR